MTSYYSTTLSDKNLDIVRRFAIKAALEKDDSITDIAKELKFSRQTIHKEIRRGTRINRKSDLTEESIYDPYKAQMASDTAKSYRGRLSIIDDHPVLVPLIRKYLKKKYSPEVIAYKLSEYFKQNKISAAPCTTTIYNYLHGHKIPYDEKDLILGISKRKKRHKKEKLLEKPNGGESIDFRPDITSRIEFGHWEIDCVIGQRAGKSTVLLTLVERKTRYAIVIKIPKKNKKSVVKALATVKKHFGKYFYDIFKTITADNGSEFKDAIGMSFRLKNGKQVKIYYAHAYCSWQRGSNENFNRMIRRYFPKGTSFTNVNDERIKAAVRELNHYPRKMFGYSSAYEVFLKEYKAIVDKRK